MRASGRLGGPRSDGEPAGLRALVIEDEVHMAGLIGSYLERAGFEVDLAHDGPRGVEAARTVDPDVVVLDIHLPGSDGLAILGQLHRRRPDIPVIVMTAFGGFDVENRARMLGAAAYFDKPFRVSDLVSALRRLRVARGSS